MIQAQDVTEYDIMYQTPMQEDNYLQLPEMSKNTGVEKVNNN